MLHTIVGATTLQNAMEIGVFIGVFIRVCINQSSIGQQDLESLIMSTAGKHIVYPKQKAATLTSKFLTPSAPSP